MQNSRISENSDSWVVGLDLGATKIAMGLINPNNQIIARDRIPTNAHHGAQAVVESIAQSIAKFHDKLPHGRQIDALGICAPGPVDHEAGMLIDPPNLLKLHNTPLRKLLIERLGIPVCLEHDAKAAALGEFYYGAGINDQSMVYIVVGTGVGAAIIADGQLYRGLHNSAGEMGHITLDRDGELCSCGSRGCVETYTSGPWLARRYERALSQTKPEQAITGELVAKMARSGDPIAKKIMTEAGEKLGIAIASMAMILGIDLYIIGGSVSKAGDQLIRPALKTVPHCSYQSVSPRIRIVATELHEDGPILGCGWLARQILMQLT